MSSNAASVAFDLTLATVFESTYGITTSSSSAESTEGAANISVPAWNLLQWNAEYRTTEIKTTLNTKQKPVQILAKSWTIFEFF